MQTAEGVVPLQHRKTRETTNEFTSARYLIKLGQSEWDYWSHMNVTMQLAAKNMKTLSDNRSPRLDTLSWTGQENSWPG